MFRKQLIEGTALKGCTKNQKTRLHKYLSSIVLRAETRNGRYTLTQLVSPWSMESNMDKSLQQCYERP